jgi:D-serine deaminase-like pyridoxal phosphate-dependent protein
VLALARHIAGRRGLRFAGLMTWEASALGRRDPQEKAAEVRRALSQITESAAQCREAGLAAEIVSCGGTGTYWLSAFFPGVTEIQAGGGALGDLTYRERLGVDLECALSVLATVTSRPTPRRIICDAGRKALSTDAVPPRPADLAGVARAGFSAEHGTIELEQPSERPRLGDKITLLAGYAETPRSPSTTSCTGCGTAWWRRCGRSRRGGACANLTRKHPDALGRGGSGARGRPEVSEHTRAGQ